jgi:hypothetical protein
MEESRSREDEWFRRNEEEMIRHAREQREKRERERAAAEAQAERSRIKELHWMRCPKCGHELREEQVDSIAIDRCSFCEGVFFDAGELEDLFLKRRQREGFLQRLLKL